MALKLQTIGLRSNPTKKRKRKRKAARKTKKRGVRGFFARRKPLKARGWIVVFYKRKADAQKDFRPKAYYWTGSSLSRSKRQARVYPTRKQAAAAGRAAFQGPARDYDAGIITHA